MIEVKLTTKQGEYVTTVNVIPMNPLPEIIQWGSRFFIEVEGKTGKMPTYREGLAIYVTDEPR